MNTLIITASILSILLYLLQEGKSDGFLITKKQKFATKQKSLEKIVFNLTAASGVMFVVLNLIRSLT